MAIGFMQQMRGQKIKVPKETANPVREDPEQKAKHTKNPWYTERDQVVTVRVIQLSRSDMARRSRNNAPAFIDYSRTPPTIYCLRMHDENSWMEFGLLGHEMWHALGGRHGDTKGQKSVMEIDREENDSEN